MQYVLGKEIGRGGMAIVYEAHDTRLDRKVAVKVLSDALAHDPEFVERFVREAKLSAKMDHPNVVTVYDTGIDDQGRPFLVMELLQGESLRQRLKRGPLTPDQAASVAISVLAALQAAHEKGIFHRDVKPGNIFLRHDGVVKLMDFGIATAFSDSRLTLTGGFVGTAEYMSPEQAEGHQVDGRSDIYAMGIVLAEMVAGDVPFTGNTLAVLHKQLHSAPPMLTGVPQWLNDIVQTALAKDPNRRYQSASRMRLALEGRGVSSTAPPSISSAAPPVRSGSPSMVSGLLIAGGILILVFAVIVVVAVSSAASKSTDSDSGSTSGGSTTGDFTSGGSSGDTTDGTTGSSAPSSTPRYREITLSDIQVWASGTYKGEALKYGPRLMFDKLYGGTTGTAWNTDTSNNGIGSTFTIEFNDGPHEISQFAIICGYDKNIPDDTKVERRDRWVYNNRVTRALISLDSGRVVEATFDPMSRSFQNVSGMEGAYVKRLTFEIRDVYHSEKRPYERAEACISEVKIIVKD